MTGVTPMPQPLPAISLVAVPRRRRQTLEIATERIPFGTAIAPIYARTVEDFAHSAAYIHEVSGGRFRFGIGIAHDPTYQRLGITPGKPLSDIRAFVEKVKS